jgi:histidinol-phosphate aminotransferase
LNLIEKRPFFKTPAEFCLMMPQMPDFATEHGGKCKFKDKECIDFSISVNPYQPEWRDEVFRRANELSMNYIYVDDIEKELGDLVGEEITITAGITEAIYLTGILLLRQAEKVLIPEYSYSEYERISRMFDCKIVKCRTESLHKAVEKNTVVFFCNPNNPDGQYFPPNNLKLLIETVEDTESILILDEAFMDFVKDFKSPEGERIIKLRTFTKSYGMPGIRTGYVAGFAREFRRARMPWNSSAGYAFLEKVIEDEFRFLRDSIPKIWDERNKIEKILGVRSDANFFLMEAGKEILTRLKSKKIIVRDCKSFGLENHIRFSVRKPEENAKLIEVLGI